MAKVQASTTISPLTFALSNGVYADDVTDVIEAHNLAGFAVGLVHRCAGQVSGLDAWGTSGNEIATHQAVFPATSGYTTIYNGQLWIDSDASQVRVYSVVTMPASNTGRVRFTVGGTNGVNTHSAGATTTASANLNTSSTGTGRVAFTIEVDHQTGSSTQCVLENWEIDHVPRTSGLPDPVE